MRTVRRENTLEGLDDLWAVYLRDRKDENRNALVAAYLPIVRNVAERAIESLPKCVQFGDLVQWGSLGLMDAVGKYDPSRNVKFPTYCRRRIWGAIYDGIRDFDSVSRTTRHRVKALIETEDRLTMAFGRTPTDSECAESLNMNSLRYRQARWAQRNASMQSLDAVKFDDENKPSRLGDILADPAPLNTSVPLSEVRTEVKRVLDHVIENYRLLDALMVKLYYLDQQTMWQIGEVFGVSESRISQRFQSVMRRLRSALAA